MKHEMNLQLFAGGHSVTVIGDAGVSSASASSSSDVQANAEVTLTVTLASGKEIDKYDVVKGGVTVDPSTKKFVMGTADVVIVIKTKGNNVYKIVENCDVWVNGSKTHLQRNLTLEKGPNGAIVGVTGDGSAVTLNSEIVAELVKAGTLIKI